jgi:hypothetical protein
MEKKARGIQLKDYDSCRAVLQRGLQLNPKSSCLCQVYPAYHRKPAFVNDTTRAIAFVSKVGYVHICIIENLTHPNK